MNQIIEKLAKGTLKPLPVWTDIDDNGHSSDTSITSTVSNDTLSQRQARFSTQANFTLIKTSTSESNKLFLEMYEGPVFHSVFLLRRSLENLTLVNIIDEAIAGIIFEGDKEKQSSKAKELARQLEFAKPSVQYAKDVYDIPDAIGRTCIRLYTMDSFWYKSITSALWNPHSITEEQFKVLGAFCYLLQTYIKKNRTNNVLTVYRGINLTDTEIEQFKQRTNPFKLTSFTSTSRRREVADMFGNTLLVFDLDTMNSRGDDLIDVGTYIGNYSQMPDEEEFLMWPLSVFKVGKYEFDQANNKHIVFLKSSLPPSLAARQ